MGVSLIKKDNNADTDPIAVVEITGEFDRNGAFSAAPWYTYDAPPSSLTACAGGEYTVTVYDDKGERLEVSNFDAADRFRVIAREGVSSPGGAAIPIRQIVRFSEEAAKIVVSKGAREIYSRNVSKRAPAVAFTGMKAGTELTSKAKVIWEASGEDGGELYFRLWYCTGAADYYLLAADIQGTSYEAYLTSYPGSKNSYFHIYATNGVRTAEAKSPAVKMPYTAPEFLTVQKEIPKIKVTDEIYFKAEIYDKQDGRLSGDAVRWVTDGGETAGADALRTRPYQLEPGLHSFTCVATNSGGVSARKGFVFEITDDESALPDDWSRSEIVRALKNGYAAPLDRIDAPIPRGQFIDMARMLYQNAHPAGLPQCGGDSADAYKSLTQREALKIMYEARTRAGEPGANAWADEDEYDENEAKVSFIKSGVFDQSKNIYQPEEKLSKKSALVWISRMDGVLPRRDKEQKQEIDHNVGQGE